MMVSQMVHFHAVSSKVRSLYIHGWAQMTTSVSWSSISTGL